MMRRSALLAVALCVNSCPAQAYWLRYEWFALQGETGRQRGRIAEFAVYESRSGLGVGAGVLESISGAWDVPRADRPDASAHALLQFFPVKAYLALASWRGPEYYHMTNRYAADRSIGKVELYGSYCGSAKLMEFSEVTPSLFFGPGERERIPGSLDTRVWDYGIRVDQGLGSSAAMTAAIGRLMFRAEPQGLFRRREFDRWYGAVSLYFGTTKGSDYGGGIGQLFLDSWNYLRGLLGGSVVHRESLPSTTP